MKLGTKGRYAVMATLDLAKYGKQAPVSLSEISERQEISLSYLEQLFSKLRQANIVTSVRGACGGYHLSRRACEITIAEIVNASEEDIRFTRCGSSRGCMSNTSKCLTHDLWEELTNHVYKFLENITLQDVLDKKSRQSPMNFMTREFDQYPAKVGINE